ncbi:hypothetical protein HJFPF1_10305 [Paramyrothecium foliicola]|nr:hypothetical protein HJFPF1_10305 [Paramyrothecium foliicola]
MAAPVIDAPQIDAPQRLNQQTPVGTAESIELENLPQPQSLSLEVRPNLVPKGRAGQIRGVIFIWVAFLIFSALYSGFIIWVLLLGRIKIGSVTFDASTSNLLVSIFSQISVLLGDTLIRNVLAIARLALVRREKGVSALTFFTIGPGSEWVAAARLSLITKMFFKWYFLVDIRFLILKWPCYYRSELTKSRVALPIMGLALGSVLKFQASFDYHFEPTNTNMTVYAGLIPVDIRVIDSLIPPADLAMYHHMWTSSLLNNNRYAVQLSVPGCTDGCRSILLPGGLEMARQAHSSSYLNHTIFENGTFDGLDSIQILNSPGMLARFERLPGSFNFDTESCAFAGERINNTLVVCVRQIGASLAVGWAACPDIEWRAQRCSREVTWKSGPMKYSTNISLYEQFTTTSYDRNNLSIVDVKLTSDLGEKQIPLSVVEYGKIYSKILAANTTTVTDISNMNSLVHSVTWTHRTYENLFPDDEGILQTNLHNFIGVSLQFMVTAVQYLNYSIPPKDLDGQHFGMPEKMLASAVGGKSMQKLKIQPWTGWIFIAVDVTILLTTAALILLLAWKVPRLPESSENIEMDIVKRAGQLVAWKDPLRTLKWRQRRQTAVSNSPDLQERPLLERIEELDGPNSLESNAALPVRGIRFAWSDAMRRDREFARLKMKWH